MAHSLEFSMKKAKNLLRKGNIEDAEKAFQSILIAFPGNPRAQDGLANCAKLRSNQNLLKPEISDLESRVLTEFSEGNHQKVIDIGAELLTSNNVAADIILKLGASYGSLKYFSKARECFEKVITLQPQDPAPWNNIGTLLKMQNDLLGAMDYYNNALAIDKNHFDSLKNIAFCYQDQGNITKAIENLEKALKIKPENFELWNSIGGFYSKIEEKTKAEEAYNKALELQPNLKSALNNLGNIHYARQDFEAAIELYEKAIESDPSYGDAFNNLANVLKDMGFLDEAIINYEKAIERNPEKAELHSNFSVVLKDRFELERSMQAINKAIEIDPYMADAYWNKALIELCGKNFEDGWKSYEWRWKATNFDSTYLPTSKPLWDGKREKVLIWQEQGIGDQIMFSTLFEEFSEFCELPIFQVDRRLIPIFRRTFPQFHFIPGDKRLAENEYDSHLPMGSICQYIRNSEDSFLNAKPSKLLADKNSSQKIRQAFRLGHKQLVGISWRSVNKSTGLMRSLSLTEFLEPLKGIDVELVNLQYGDCTQEIREAYDKTGIAVKSVNEIDTFTNIDHLASLIDCCDRVITIDNSTVHLSASMGKQTDLLLPFVTDWRWCGGQKKPMWYDCLTVHKAPYGIHLNKCIKRLINDCFS